MSMKRFNHLLTLGLITLLSNPLFACTNNDGPQTTVSQESTIPNEFDFAVKSILNEKLAALESAIHSKEIIIAIEKSNAETSSISQKEILELDAHWRKADVKDPQIRSKLLNDCALLLGAFQSENSGFAEIFITDKNGLNVCMTNKTSDYLQADEDWWKETYNNGMGKRHHGEIVFDESAHSEGIPLYIPLNSAGQDKVIGIAKAVLDVSQIKREL